MGWGKKLQPYHIWLIKKSQLVRVEAGSCSVGHGRGESEVASPFLRSVGCMKCYPSHETVRDIVRNICRTYKVALLNLMIVVRKLIE